MNRFAFLYIVASVCMIAASSPARAQRDARVPDPDPEIERQSFIVADGFEVNLFAADPRLAKPIQMCFDPAGRLWLACSETYPQIKPGQNADDKIIILEDTKGVGRADKATVFAEGLLIPTGIAPGDGGVYVANSTDLLHLSDTDGDGKANRTRVVLSGFGTEDTHHMLHSLRWGPDGMLYMNQSIYIHSHLETPHGPRRLNGGGIWQFRPQTMELDVFARGWVNAWGHHFDRWGQSFVTDGAGGEGINYVIPGGYYTTAVSATKIFPGLNPGSPKYCGEEIISGRHLPDDWQGNIITNDFRGHRVCRFVLKEDGSGFAAQEKTELIKTKHDAFRPIDVRMGPDGAIYIADWYNPIIQHGEVDFRDPRRDHTHGRIWRVTAKSRPLVPRPRLVDATTEELLDALKAPEDWTRQQARRVIQERGAKTVEPALATWVAARDAKDAEYEHDLLEALWTFQAIDVVEPNLLAKLLHAREPRARAAAVRVVSGWRERLPDPLGLLTPAVTDPNPRVRLEAVRALAKIPQSQAVAVALHATDLPRDRFLDYALDLTVRELEPIWLPTLREGKLDFAGHESHLVFALEALATPEVVPPLAELLRAGKISREQEESVLKLIARQGGPPELRMIFDLVTSKETSQAQQIAGLLGALEQATRQRNVRPTGDLSGIGKLLAVPDDVCRATAARLLGLWQVEALRPRLVQYARATDTNEALRQAAVDGLMHLGGKASRQALEDLAAPSQPPAHRQLAITALASFDLTSASNRAADLLATTTGMIDPTPLISAFLQRKNGAELLTKALSDRKLPADTAKLSLRTVRGSGRDFPELVAALNKAGNLTIGPRVLAPKELEQMVADVAKQGDAARGETIFRRKDLGCLKCHAIAGAGGQVGPDLASIGASAQVDYLTESLLLPNKAIKENYHTLVVSTREGRIFTGIKVRENKTELVLRDAEDKEIIIPTRSIDDKLMGGSLMPDGLTDSLTHAELLDLVRFLSELGKVGPYSVSKARLVRRWQVLDDSSEARQYVQRLGRDNGVPQDSNLAWSPAYSMVSGVLPLDSVPTTGVVRCSFIVSTPGKIKLLLNSSKGLKLWLDGSPVNLQDEISLDLKSGKRIITILLDRTERKEGLRFAFEEIPGSPAKLLGESGK